MRRTIMPYREENIFLRHYLKRKSFSPIVQLLSRQKLTTTTNTLTIKETKLKQQESLSSERSCNSSWKGDDSYNDTRSKKMKNQSNQH